ncbi:Corticotropin-releasing factor receptor 1 [Portunus trituberculatus]|uniref:Corticotropin-releasing factor receptor 1 n=1 Tax=Portunus trituberculatus TaxID=210409 RepID=A0A5B7F2Z4_PORTR|nr:Corticotropin-releasing factor receptor 1 [Portunus trituberculatus]
MVTCLECCVLLQVNLVFLVNIIRILVTKLRANDTLETEKISTRGHTPQYQSSKATRVHHRFKREPSQYHHTLRQQHLPNNNSLQPEQKHSVLEEGRLHRNRSCHTGNDSGWHHNSLTKEVESTTHNRESSPLLRQESPLKQAAQQNQGSHLPRRQFTGSRRSLHTNSLQHYPSVGYAANRPEFNTRKAIRATVILFPLLGITNLLFAVNPGGKGDLENAYMLTNAILQSSQAGSSSVLGYLLMGLFVSVFYCFLNTEVQELLRKRWRQYRTRQRDRPTGALRASTRCTLLQEKALSRQQTPSPHLQPKATCIQGLANPALETSVSHLSVWQHGIGMLTGVFNGGKARVLRNPVSVDSRQLSLSWVLIVCDTGGCGLWLEADDDWEAAGPGCVMHWHSPSHLLVNSQATVFPDNISALVPRPTRHHML